LSQDIRHNGRFVECCGDKICLQIYCLPSHPSVCLSDLSVCVSFCRSPVRISVSPFSCLSACPSVCPSVCHSYLFVCFSVCPSVCLSVCLSVRLSICPSVHLSVCLSVCPSVRLSVCLYVCLSERLSVRLSVHPSVHPSVCPSPICLSIFLSVRLSNQPFTCLSAHFSVSLSVYSKCHLHHKANEHIPFAILVKQSLAPIHTTSLSWFVSLKSTKLIKTTKQSSFVLGLVQPSRGLFKNDESPLGGFKK
jgi:hypothetical protein